MKRRSDVPDSYFIEQAVSQAKERGDDPETAVVRFLLGLDNFALLPTFFGRVEEWTGE